LLPHKFFLLLLRRVRGFAEQYEELRKLHVEVITVSTNVKFAYLAWQRDDKMPEIVNYPMGPGSYG